MECLVCRVTLRDCDISSHLNGKKHKAELFKQRVKKPADGKWESEDSKLKQKEKLKRKQSYALFLTIMNTPKLIERIFSYIPVYQLLPLRLVCPAWNNHIFNPHNILARQQHQIFNISLPEFSALEAKIIGTPLSSFFKCYINNKESAEELKARLKDGMFPKHLKLKMGVHCNNRFNWSSIWRELEDAAVENVEIFIAREKGSDNSSGDYATHIAENLFKFISKNKQVRVLKLHALTGLQVTRNPWKYFESTSITSLEVDATWISQSFFFERKFQLPESVEEFIVSGNKTGLGCMAVPLLQTLPGNSTLSTLVIRNNSIDSRIGEFKEIVKEIFSTTRIRELDMTGNPKISACALDSLKEK